MRTDTSGFRANQARVRANRTVARTLAVRTQADVVVGYAAAHIQRDTQRAARSVIEAGNTAGLRQRQLPELRPSRSSKRIGEALRGAVRLSMRNVEIWSNRVAKWERFEALYRSKGRAHYQYFSKIIAEKRLAQKELRFHTRRLEAAIRELEQFESSDSFTGIAIGTWGITEDLKVNTQAAIRYGKRSAIVLRRGVAALRRNIQIETKIYGGTGRIIQSPGSTFVSLTMHEPHFRLVERRTRIMARSLAHARSASGARRTSKKTYVDAVSRGTTWTQKGAA